MKKIGFLISHKNNEARRALLPKEVKLLKHPEMLFFETGYGESVGASDDEYLKAGANIVSRKEAMDCDIICDVKLGDADYLDELEDGKLLFGWAHAVQNIDFTTKAVNHKHTVIAWEEIFEDGRYIFYRNREIAGEAAIMQAYQYCKRMPYDTKVAILGNGQTAKGAMRILHGLGAEVDVYGRRLEHLFKEKMFEYDVIVNCIMWDTERDDHIIYKEDVSKMKDGTLIIDVSCDPHLGIETSRPTTISDPVYTVDGVLHYAVDNTPAMFPISVTKILSENGYKFYDTLIEEGELPNSLKEALVIKDGEILSKEIIDFRKKHAAT